MNLQKNVSQWLTQKLVKKIPSFVARKAQQDMADLFSQAIDQSKITLIEAATGTGKTYAYLLPALLSQKKILISTATKNLQEQLFSKDIPQLQTILQTNLSVTVLKGRSNYLCKQRFDEFSAHIHETYSDVFSTISQNIERPTNYELFGIIPEIWTGDRHLLKIEEKHPVWPLVTSTKENCSGQDCGYFKDCFVFQARKQALESDVLVVNHHLFCADLKLKTEGVAEILPSRDVLIFDEAHQLPQTSTQFLGESISAIQCLNWLKSVSEEVQKNHVLSAECASQIQKIKQGLELIRLPQIGRFEAKNESLGVQFCDNFNLFIDELSQLFPLIEPFLSVNNEGQNIFLKGKALLNFLKQWQTQLFPLNTEKNNENNNIDEDTLHINQNINEDNKKDSIKEIDIQKMTDIYWFEQHQTNATWGLTPLETDRIWKKQYLPHQTWLFTSATLMTNQGFDTFAYQMGIDVNESLNLCLESPFNYQKQGLFYIPQAHNNAGDKFPELQDHDYIIELLNQTQSLWNGFKKQEQKTQKKQAKNVEEQIGFKGFLLCTSHKAVQDAMDYFSRTQADTLILCQQTHSKTQLLKTFAQEKKRPTMLIGTYSFWEGIDEQLDYVIIDKLPFVSPDDPLMKAKEEKLREKGQFPFMLLQMPEMLTQLRQGVGRLIRHENSKGVLILGDRRIFTKNYGDLIQKSLPDFKYTREWSVVEKFIQ